MATSDGQPYWFDDPALGDRTRQVYEVLARVWSSAVDAATSEDLRRGGQLDEDAYLRMQRNTFAKATEQLRALDG